METAYLAGLFDGEGCLALTTQKSEQGKPTYLLAAGLSMCDPAPVKLFHDRFGGGYSRVARRTSKHRDVFKWVVSGKDVIPVVEELYPWIIAKRPQFDLVREYLQTIGVQRGRGRFTPSQKAYQAEVFKRLQALKRVVYPK